MKKLIFILIFLLSFVSIKSFAAQTVCGQKAPSLRLATLKLTKKAHRKGLSERPVIHSSLTAAGGQYIVCKTYSNDY